jgi:CBS domain containing-hemolysin-like protein
MLSFIVALICLALALAALVLRKTYFYLPHRELQRQAAAREPLATILWRAAAFGDSLKVFLWLAIGLFAAAGFVLLARIAPPLLGFIAGALLLWLGFVWMPATRLTGVGAQLAVWCTPTVVWLLNNLRPVFSRLANLVSGRMLGNHTGVYEKEDLLEILERQQSQPDSRVSPDVLQLTERALRFDEYKVADVVVPRSGVKAIALKEPIGPVLMDELHAVRHVRFPVYADDKNTIVGTVYLRDIVDSKQSGQVKDYADKHVFYVHENDSLAEALRAFHDAKQQMLVVVNSFEEYVGIVTPADVLNKLLPEAAPAFDQHDDKQAVAKKHEKQLETEDKQPEPEPENTPEVAEQATEVVE